MLIPTNSSKAIKKHHGLMVYTTHKHGKSISIWGWWILWILLLCWVPCRAAQGKDEMLLAKTLKI